MPARTREQLDLWELGQKARTLQSLKSVSLQLLDFHCPNAQIYRLLLRLYFPSLLGTYEQITEEGLKCAILDQIKAQLILAEKASLHPIAALDEMTMVRNWSQCSWARRGYDQVLARNAATTAQSTRAMQDYAAQFRRPPQVAPPPSPEVRHDNLEETSQQSFQYIYREIFEDTPLEIYAMTYASGDQFIY